VIGTGQSLVSTEKLKKVEIRFGSSETSKAYRYIRGVPTFPPVPPRDPSFDQYILKKGPGAVNQGDYDAVTVPFSAWEIDSLDGDPTPRRLNVGFLENNDSLYAEDGSFLGRGLIDAQWGPTTAENGGLEVIYVFASTYADTAGAIYSKRADQFQNLDIYYVVHLRKTAPNALWQDGDRITLTPNYVLVGGRTFDVTTVAPVSSTELASQQMERINVVPNPYFGRNAGESNQFNRFVTFTHLPQVAKIRIITITGELVRTIEHNDDTSLEQWDLRNSSSLPVASGVYIVHIEIPDAGSRILKLAIIQPEERATRI
jgi:hypothetical protein